jgi:hypothetical protein
VAYSFLVSSLSKTLRLFALNHEKEGQAAPASAAAETGKQADILLIPILHPTCFLISRRGAETQRKAFLSFSASLRLCATTFCHFLTGAGITNSLLT